MKRRKSDDSSSSASTSAETSTNYHFSGQFCRPRQAVCYLLLFFAGVQLADALHEERCPTIDIRNFPDMISNAKSYNFMNCTTVEGSVLVSMVFNSYSNQPHNGYPRFENLREITGFLLVFSSSGLTNLSYMFPNLRVIGGSRNVQHYSLVIYQNPELTSVGLENLRVIRQGGVRITENVNLCYAASIDWKHITTGLLNDIVVEDSDETDTNFVDCNNQCSSILDANQCRRVDDKVTSRSHGQVTACWSPDTCQLKCEHDRIESEAGPGCPDDDPTVACHKECIGGCTEPDDDSKCYACRNIHHEGRCLPECPEGQFLFRNRRCLSEMACLNQSKYKQTMDLEIPYKAVNGICHYHCPDNYEDVPGDSSKCRPCEGVCERSCVGNVTITSISDALKFKTCTNVSGYLIIEIRNGMENVAPSMLAEAFGRIRVIDGYLVIRQCNFLINLSMFKNLTTITGRDLTDTFALAIYENKNLRKLLDLSHRNFTIQRGLVQLYNNYQLCFKEIELFFDQMGRRDEMTDEHQSRTSNGVSKAICDESTLDVEVGEVSYNTIELCWAMSDTSDMDHRKFLGFQIFYKKVKEADPEMTIDDDRSACSDSWEQEFFKATKNETESETKQTHIRICEKITNERILPDSTYAIYVKSSVAKHDGARVDTSKIVFVKTLFSYPDAPKIVDATYGSKDTASSSVTVEWGPSLRPNGEVTHYSVMIRAHKEPLAELQKLGCSSTNYATTLDTLKKAIANNGHLSGKPKSSATAATGGASLVKEILKGKDAQQTCSASGCCACQANDVMKKQEKDHIDGAQFENSLMDMVIKPSCKYAYDPERCHPEDTTRAEGDGEEDSDPEEERRRRHKREIEDLAEFRRQQMYRARHAIRNTIRDIDIEINAPIRGKRSITAEPIALERPSTPKDGKHVISPPKTKKPPPVRITAAPVRKIVTTSTTSTTTTTTTTSSPTTTSEETTTPRIIEVNGDKKAVGDQAWTIINVTGMSYVFTGLKHFTSYGIGIAACQNVSVPEATCSQKRTFDHIHTAPIPEKDLVDVGSIQCNVVNKTHGNVRITWAVPEDPNGGIVSFRIRAQTADSNTGKIHCQEMNDTWDTSVEGITLLLDDGDYSVYIQTQSLAGLSAEVVAENICTVRTPKIYHTREFWAVMAVIMIVLIIATPFIAQFVRNQFQMKIKKVAGKMVSANPEYLTIEDIYHADEWEVAAEQITVHDVIGSGSFGCVSRGMGNNVTTPQGDNFGPCAIKVAQENSNSSEKLVFLMEAQVMKQFKSPFITKLLGVVSVGTPTMVIMEYMENGNLRDYLRMRRPEDNPDMQPIDEAYFVIWASQIADGMAYLEWKQFCHRDLAARNVLLNAELTAKIGDFGMARDIFYNEYYRPGGKRMMPVRWMAPESLRDGRFDTKSDVWSYGIVLYEMVTLGSQPYQGLSNEDVVQMLTISRRCMDRPTGLSDYWWNQIRRCWGHTPSERPDFREIVNNLADNVARFDPHFMQMSFVFNPLPLEEERSKELKGKPKAVNPKDDKGGFYFDISDYAKVQGIDSFTTDAKELDQSAAAVAAAAQAALARKDSIKKKTSGAGHHLVAAMPSVENEYNSYKPTNQNRVPRAERKREGQEMIAMDEMSASASPDSTTPGSRNGSVRSHKRADGLL